MTVPEYRVMALSKIRAWEQLLGEAEQTGDIPLILQRVQKIRWVIGDMNSFQESESQLLHLYQDMSTIEKSDPSYVLINEITTDLQTLFFQNLPRIVEPSKSE